MARRSGTCSLRLAAIDLHPSDRGPQGTHAGATLANGNLYCPGTPNSFLQIAPLKRAATTDETDRHDRLTTEAARYKLGPISPPDPDSYHRVTCPAVAGKLRCPHRPESLTLGYDRPTIATPPDPAPASNDTRRGWNRLMGLTAITIFLAATTAARNLRIVDAFEARQADQARRAANGQPPRTRRRRRKTLADLLGANAPP